MIDANAISSAASDDLREMLLTAERRREAAEQARAQAEVVLAGLEVLATADNDQELFDGILDVVSDVIEFDAAAIIVELEGQLDIVVASARDETPFQLLRCDGFVDRVLTGAPAVAFDLDLLPAWADVAASGAGHRSAIFVPLRSSERRAMLVFVAATQGAYSQRHIEILDYIAPLAGQALQRYQHMSELERLIKRLERMAHRDDLTGLANRTAFTNALERSIAAYQHGGVPLAILHVDLDHFKVVNDTLGHGAGDELLRIMSERLLRGTRDAEVVARLGGDEFAVLLSGVASSTQAEAIAERLLGAVNRPLRIDGHEIRPSASVGVCVCPSDDTDPNVLLSSADIALYDAKAAGGGRAVRFSTDMREQRNHDRRIERAIERGLARGEFALHYQPIYRVGEHEPAGFEALVRWMHPDQGTIPPAEFVPVAERSNLIVDLGDWVLRTALTETADWLQAGSDRRVSVNVAAYQLLAPDFVDAVLHQVAAHGLEPSSLELELSEEIVGSRTVDSMLECLSRLDRAGVLLAFDDFGTGYSSVQQLRTFPGHRLKIDRQFVAKLDQSAADRAVVGGMIDLARGMGLNAVAEGVESRLQCEYVRALGGAELQGFFLGRPAPWETGLHRPEIAAAS